MEKKFISLSLQLIFGSLLIATFFCNAQFPKKYGDPKIDYVKEINSHDTLKEQPVVFLSISQKENNQWILTIGLIEGNEEWLPGIDSTGFPFLDSIFQVRKLIVNENTKAYRCTQDSVTYAGGWTLTSGIDFINSIPNSNTIQFANSMHYTASMDFDRKYIYSIKEHCLP